MRLTESSASEISGMVNALEVSVAEVVEDVLARIEEVDQWVHASCTLDTEGARHSAKRIQDCANAGEVLPLAGVPVAVKDLLDTAGLRTTYSSWAYRAPNHHRRD